MFKAKTKSIFLYIVITGVLIFSACENKVESDEIPVEDIKLEESVIITDEHSDSDEQVVIDDKPSDSDEQVVIDDKPSDSDELVINNNQGIRFVQQDNFYQETICVEIESDRSCDIYYTLDGSEPDKTKELYDNNIELPLKSHTQLVTIKAKAYYEDGTETDTIIHNYFLDKDINNRFDTLIFSVTTDPYNLYDYEYGILIEGKLRDDYIKENPSAIIEPPAPANFNMRGRESEREVYLEVFETDGKVVVSQNAGIRVYGGWSRANNQKSIKLFARKEYDELNNKFRYEFFPNRRAGSGDGTIISSFKRLVLRNSGNDNGFAFIRDELFQTLADQAGYKDYHFVRPATLFINGKYQGVLWLHEVWGDEYFKEHYGRYEGSFEVLEGGETFKKADEDGSNQYAIDDYEKAYSFTYKDLTDDAVYEELSKLIDVENYLAYYALQIHIGNDDWPHNNYKTYRYYAKEGEDYREAPFDGKWRYLLHDLDYSFGIYGSSPWKDNFQQFVSRKGNVKKESPLFSQLMKREDCREYFIKKSLDLVNGAFSPDNLNKVLDEMNRSRINELQYMYNTDLLADWLHPNQLPDRIAEIKQYGLDRVAATLGKLRMFFDLGEMYRLNVVPANGGGVCINGIETYSEFSGKFYPDYDTVISPIVPAGDELDHWLVNGEAIYEADLIVNSSMIIDGEVEVVCVFREKAKNPKLIIRELRSDGDNDYIILYNPYEEDVSMVGYSITDNKDEPGKLILPPRLLRSGQSLKILGESNKEPVTEGMVRAGYNLSEGETVVLYKEGESVDQVTIPNLDKGNLYIRDLKTMRFFEEKR